MMDLRWTFFCSQQRKAVSEIEAHLVAEHRACAGAGAVAFIGAVFEDVSEKVEILSH